MLERLQESARQSGCFLLVNFKYIYISIGTLESDLLSQSTPCGTKWTLVYLQWNLPYPDLYYPGTSIVWTAQIGHVACSLFTIMKFGLDESTRREPKGCCLPV